MPPPRYPTPANTFGIAKKPLEQWFDATTSGYERTGPAFSNEIEDALIRNDQRALDQERLRRQLESEAAASAFMAKAAGQNPQGLMRMIADDPAILGSEGFGQIRDYVGMRQEIEEVEQPFSNQVLEASIMKSLPPMKQMKVKQRTAAGIPIYEAVEQVEEEERQLATQQEFNKAKLKLIEEGADENEVAAANDPVSIARIRGKLAKEAAAAKATTGRGTAGKEADPIKRLSDLSALRDKALEQDNQGLLAYVDEQIKSLITPPPTAATDDPNLSTGAGGAATDTTKTQPPAGDQKIDKPVRWPNEGGVPLGKYEEAQAKKLAEAEAKQAEKDKERMGQWTSVKDAITRDFNNDPVAFLNEAKAAVLGKKAANPAAQKLADFALAQEVGRKVQIGESQRVVPGAGMGAGASVNLPIMASPAEALVMELGLKPNDPVGTITEPSGRKREVTALEAAEARLNEVLIPLREQQKKDKAAADAAPNITAQDAASIIDEVDK